MTDQRWYVTYRMCIPAANIEIFHNNFSIRFRRIFEILILPPLKVNNYGKIILMDYILISM